VLYRAIGPGGFGFERGVGEYCFDCDRVIQCDGAFDVEHGFHRLALALRCAAFHPLDDPVNLRLTQAGVVTELSYSALGSPGRHFAVENLIADGFGPGADLFISRQRYAASCMAT